MNPDLCPLASRLKSGVILCIAGAYGRVNISVLDCVAQDNTVIWLLRYLEEKVCLFFNLGTFGAKI